MAGRISPYIDNTGLVFAYDLANIKRSYLGEPTTNLIDSVNFTTDYNTSWNAQENIIQTKNQINPLGDIDVTAIKIESNSNSDNYFGVRGIKFASSGTNHTFSFWAKGNKAYNNFPINFGAYQIQVTVNITTEWKYFTVQTGAGTTFTDHTLHFGGWGTWTDNTFDLFLWRPQLELKSHATPYANGTRSVTQGLKDLTGNSTIDLTNVSFDANAQMTFDGTNDYVEMSSFNIDQNNEFTLEAIIYPNTVSGNQSIIKKNTSNDNWPIFSMTLIGSNINGYYSSPTYGQCLEGADGTSGIITANKFWHVAYSKGAGGYTTMKLYINGVSVPYSNFLYGSHINSIATSTKPIHIGRNLDGASWIQPFNGIIPVSRGYNRQLTDSEIQQNFNAIKGRYGL